MTTPRLRTRPRPHRGRRAAAVVLALGLLAGGCEDPGAPGAEGTTTTTARPTTTVGTSPVGSSTTAATTPTSTPPTTAAPRPAGGRWLMGYYPIYQRDLLPPAEVPWGSLTHLAVGRVVPRADGSLERTFDHDERQGPAVARDLAQRARANGVVPILMVGGAGTYDGFSAAAASPARLARTLADEARSLGFGGLDLDLEPITTADEPHIVALARELRRIAPELQLAVPVAWTSTTFPTVSSAYRDLAASVDQINVMSYGMAGAWDGWESWHSSALDGAGGAHPSSVAVSVQSYLDAGVPAAKLGVGIGFYGSCWNAGITGPRQPLGRATVVADDNTMSATTIRRSYDDPAARRYDDVAEVPYLAFSRPTGPQGCTFVSYEDERSVAAKGAFVRRLGLGGAIVWTINEGHDDRAPVAQHDALLAATWAALR